MRENIKHLPLQNAGFTNMVAVPYLLTASEPLHTVLRLALKEVEIIPAKHGLSQVYTVNGVTDTAYRLMFGRTPFQSISHAINTLRHALERDAEAVIRSIYDPASASGISLPPFTDPGVTSSPLDSPEQFAMAWTTYAGIYDHALPYLPAFVSSITDADAATEQFWPTIANYSFPHNLIALEKLTQSRADEIKSRFGPAWASEGLDAACSEDRLYALDMSIFDCLPPAPATGRDRFTHATFTLLRQDPESKALTPVAVWISGKNYDGRPRLYTRKTASTGAWLFALQAAKVSITVYAIWLRHVYLWHIVPSTMQMTTNNALPPDHPIYLMLAPQSKFTIPFNEVMFLLWEFVSPPTSIGSSVEFLTIADQFAKGRGFFDDDPKVLIGRLGLREEDFTRSQAWDLFPTVKDLLQLWDATEEYVDACVDATYSDDAAIASDKALQAWVAASSAVDQGNIRGLEPLDGRAALKRLLTSILHRVVAHGGANEVFTTTLVHLFQSNFSICLQRRDIPEPDAELNTKQLLTFMPNTETVGIMAGFYFSFAFTKPYEPFVPKDLESNLFFPSSMDDPRNRALVAYRIALIEFVADRQIVPDQVYQWPLNVET
jgi:Lipoxygenase